MLQFKILTTRLEIVKISWETRVKTRIMFLHLRLMAILLSKVRYYMHIIGTAEHTFFISYNIRIAYRTNGYNTRGRGVVFIHCKLIHNRSVLTHTMLCEMYSIYQSAFRFVSSSIHVCIDKNGSRVQYIESKITAGVQISSSCTV